MGTPVRWLVGQILDVQSKDSPIFVQCLSNVNPIQVLVQDLSSPSPTFIQQMVFLSNKSPDKIQVFCSLDKDWIPGSGQRLDYAWTANISTS